MHIGIAGAGHYAGYLLQRLRGTHGMNLESYVSKISIADPQKRMLEEKAQTYSLSPEDLHEDIQEAQELDLVLVATSENRHHDVAAPLLKKGIPVMLSKPLDADIKKARELVQFAEETKTPSGAGSQMHFHPAYVEAVNYLREHDAVIKRLDITWNKERGPRDHPISGATYGEMPHPVALTAQLLGTTPKRIAAIARKGLVVIDKKKWDEYGNPEFVEILEEAQTQYLGKMETMSQAMLDYGLASARIVSDMEDPYKQRRMQIVAELAETDLFDSHVSIDANLTFTSVQEAQENPSLQQGIRIYKGTTAERSGLGHLIKEESYGKTDEIGTLIKAFLDYVQTGERHETLPTLRQEYEATKLVDRIYQATKE